MLPFFTALLLGFLHAFGPDHLAAVSTFVSHGRSLRSACLVSVRWGMGHLIAVLLLGVGVSSLGITLPERFEPYAEAAVGLALVVVGVISLWRFWRSKKLHRHWHVHGALMHSHLHTHAEGEEHFEGHAVTLMGVVHGLAGAVPAVALFPLSVMGSPWLLGAYLLVFGLGVILGMSLYCVALSGLLRRLSETGLRRWAQPTLATGCCVLGVIWMLRTDLLL